MYVFMTQSKGEVYMKLQYEIELTGDSPRTLSGGTDIAGALCILLQSANVLESCSGQIEAEKSKAKLRLEARKDCGVYLCLTNKEGTYLSLRDSDDLAESIDCGGEEYMAARGLFIPPADAMKAIRGFAVSGKPADTVKWIMPEELPEGTEYII